MPTSHAHASPALLDGPEVLGAQTISRAARALQILASHAPDGLRLVDMAREFGLPRSTVHRLLRALTVEDMLQQDPRTRRYSLGTLLFELGIFATHPFNLRNICQPACSWLAEQTGDTTFLFLRSGYDAVCISRTQGAYPTHTPSLPLGSRQPLGVNAGGLALLAALPEAEISHVINAVAPSLGTYANLNADDLRKLVSLTQRSGYSFTSNYAVPGIYAIGLPILNAAKLPIAALTVAATQARMAPARIKTLLPKLRTASREVARLLNQ